MHQVGFRGFKSPLYQHKRANRTDTDSFSVGLQRYGVLSFRSEVILPKTDMKVANGCS